MRLAGTFVVTLILALGCGRGGELREEVDQRLRKEAHEKFVQACQRSGAGGQEKLSKQGCTCIADEVLREHTSRELLEFAADPDAKALVPIVKTCVGELVK